MDTHDSAALQELLRLVDGPAAALQAGAKVRWTFPSALALLVARRLVRDGRMETAWIDAPSEGEAERLAKDLSALLPGATVAYFPGMAPFAGGESSPPGLVLKARLATLVGLLERRVHVLVTGPLAAFEKLPHPTWFEKQKLLLAKGSEVPRELLLETLVALGYRRSELASNPGEFSSRGLVVDLWPDHLDQPLRLETFGDELERLSPFDPDTQRRTGEELDRLVLYPRYEGERAALMKAVESRSGATQDAEDDLAFRRQRLATHGHFPGEELFYPLLPQPAGQLAHWVPPCLRLKLDEPWLAALREQEERRILEGVTTLRRGGVVCPEFGDRFLAADPSRATAHLTEWQSEASVPLSAQQPMEYQGRLGDLAKELRIMAQSGVRIFLAGSTPGMRDRLREILGDYELPLGSGSEPGCRAFTLRLEAGAFLREPQVLLLSEREIFGRRAIQSAPKKGASQAFMSDLRDLKVGDAVVHLDHGIGEFVGFETQIIGGQEFEVLKLRYADGGMLNVSLERADLLQRYTSPDGGKPTLDKLGGTSWAKVKRRAKKAIRDMAEELLKLYAKRKLEKGHAYAPDDALMAEFEASFPFEATPDQLEATEAIKRDLESDRPMDRLLVGDVGFGKTEVALRAAAKVALQGRQVAVLCPTTILSFQHYRTFRDRFAPFPIRVEQLDRFVDKEDQKRVLQDLAGGKVDVLVGTHQILGARVDWSDLGLVVIDEEQRFGVGHKEKLKKLRVNVDMLTLSATPIPRTLHMGLTGLREISLIETPPKNRLAIETVVAPWSDELIQSAIQFELRRAGQVYVVHNRVDSIDAIADRIRMLVPEARIGVGHGQMGEEELERVMVAFMEGRLDVLVATTIVENGLDVPNANTLIVHRADIFGLSQLYQLRGRVGRSDVPAYAYLLIPGKGELTEDARRRLQALEDFSELGSGFRVAAMDLELRGAGNLLGGEQSGHIHDIGFELYLKLLEETLQELKGEASGTFEVKLDLGAAQLGRRWIDQASERLVAYKRVSRLRTLRDLELYRMDLEDRFGQIRDDDDETLRFFELLKVRIQAQALAISEVSLQSGRLRLKPSPQTPLDTAKLLTWVSQQKGAQATQDGAVLLPPIGIDVGPIVQAQRVLEAWQGLVG